jgi:hypothetical protein
LDAEVDVGLRAGDRHPPLSPIRGGGQIMGSIENFQRLLDLHPSPMNARLQAHSRLIGRTSLSGPFAHSDSEQALHVADRVRADRTLMWTARLTRG